MTFGIVCLVLVGVQLIAFPLGVASDECLRDYPNTIVAVLAIYTPYLWMVAAGFFAASLIRPDEPAARYATPVVILFAAPISRGLSGRRSKAARKS